MYNSSNTTHVLHVRETKSAKTRFLYIVREIATNEIVSTRSSNRKYVACTAHGDFYFGRTELIGKGDHGKRIRWANDNQKLDALMAVETIAYLEN